MRLSICNSIPLYSAVPEIHDSIVGAKGAFRETIMGLHNLAKFRIPVEIRIVLTKQNITGLVDLADFIGWNLSMAVHVAFMGMEIHGRADDNKGKVWVEPANYMQELTIAVKNIAHRNIPVSIYNLPLLYCQKNYGNIVKGVYPIGSRNIEWNVKAVLNKIIVEAFLPLL